MKILEYTCDICDEKIPYEQFMNGEPQNILKWGDNIHYFCNRCNTHIADAMFKIRKKVKK